MSTRRSVSGFGLVTPSIEYNRVAWGAPAGQAGAGRSISLNYVEDVIRTGDTSSGIVNGVTRSIHTSGTVVVVTEEGGRIVVTVNPFSGA